MNQSKAYFSQGAIHLFGQQVKVVRSLEARLAFHACGAARSLRRLATKVRK
jgi:hypothetical protein